MESAITVKGQATIPKAIREHLRLKPGDTSPSSSCILMAAWSPLARNSVHRRQHEHHQIPRRRQPGHRGDD